MDKEKKGEKYKEEILRLEFHIEKRNGSKIIAAIEFTTSKWHNVSKSIVKYYE